MPGFFKFKVCAISHITKFVQMRTGMDFFWRGIVFMFGVSILGWVFFGLGGKSCLQQRTTRAVKTQRIVHVIFFFYGLFMYQERKKKQEEISVSHTFNLLFVCLTLMFGVWCLMFIEISGLRHKMHECVAFYVNHFNAILE